MGKEKTLKDFFNSKEDNLNRDMPTVAPTIGTEEDSSRCVDISVTCHGNNQRYKQHAFICIYS